MPIILRITNCSLRSLFSFLVYMAQAKYQLWKLYEPRKIFRSSAPETRKSANYKLVAAGNLYYFPLLGRNLHGTCFKFSLNARKSPSAALVMSFLLACRAAREFLSFSSRIYLQLRAQGIQISSLECDEIVLCSKMFRLSSKVLNH
jgi:hypothetical protein